MVNDTHSHMETKIIDNKTIGKCRSSNLELYRIVCMLLIVTHHYVVNSGLNSPGGPIVSNPLAPNSIYLLLFGMWGKVGINCFLMITGYFMCTSQITLRKFLKLLLQIYLYKLVIFGVFLATGYETISFSRIIQLIMPVMNIKDEFTGCFLIFFLTIPFWNILLKSMTNRQHILLLILMLTIYTFMGSVPWFTVSFNYVIWFGVIYLIASYFRLYPHHIFERRKLWGLTTVGCLALSMLSVLLLQTIGVWSYFFVIDSNKILAVAVAVCSFLWFKNMNIKYNKNINAFGAATFGVLLIHANSKAMQTWLWKDTVDAVGHYTLPLGNLILYSILVVLIIFIVCNLIDQLRIATVEKWFFHWYDNKVSEKAERWIEKVTSNNK